MLKFIRRNADASWVKFIFAAIVVVFIFWGMGGGFVGSDKSIVVARVNDDAIEPAAFNRAYNNLRRVYQDIYKDNFKPEIAKALDLKGKAVDQLINNSLMRQEANGSACASARPRCVTPSPRCRPSSRTAASTKTSTCASSAPTA